MLTGGDSQRGPLASNELYDDRRQAYRPLSAMPEPRNSHCSTRLANGEILITGGSSPTQSQLPSALVFSPNSNVWHNLPPMPEARAGHRAVLLRSGHVLIAGGWKTGAGGQPLGTTLLFASP